jgi:hypothetical protein
MNDYESTPLEQAVLSGNLVFLKRANTDPKRCNILSFFDQASWSPEPEIIEYLLSFTLNLSGTLESGRIILKA